MYWLGWTDADAAGIERISELVEMGEPVGFDELQDASAMRVSLPISVIDETPQLVRVDKKSRGATVYRCFSLLVVTDSKYTFCEGGLVPTTDSVSSRFTI